MNNRYALLRPLRRPFHLAGSAMAVLILVMGTTQAYFAPSVAAEQWEGQSPQYLLVGGTASKTMASLRVENDGSLSPVPGSPFSVGLGALSIVVAADGRTVFVTEAAERAVTGYRVEDDGTVRPIPGSKAQLSGIPITSALSPDGSQLYVAVGGLPGHVQTFSVSPHRGITPAATKPQSVPGLSALTMVTVDPDGRFLRVTSFIDSAVHTFATSDNGALTPVGSVARTGGGANNPGYTPDGRYFYVSHELGNSISGFGIGDDGTLTPTPGSPYPTGGLMAHGAEISVDGRHLYVPNVAGGSVAAFGINPDGSLAPLAGSPYRLPRGSGPGQVKLSDNGRKLYAADVLTTNITTELHIFDVLEDGRLSASDLPPVDTGVLLADGPVLKLTR